MTDEITSQEQEQPTADVEALKKSVEALERKNYELIGKLNKAKAADVDVQALIDFKAKAEETSWKAKGDTLRPELRLSSNSGNRPLRKTSGFKS